MKRIGSYIKIVLHNKYLPRAESQHEKGYSVNQMFWYYILEKAFQGKKKERKKGHSWYIYIKLDRKNKQITSLLKKKCPPSAICSVFYFLDGCFDLVHRMYCRLFPSHVVVLLSILQCYLNLICATVLFLNKFCIFAVFYKMSIFLISRDLCGKKKKSLYWRINTIIKNRNSEYDD